MEQRDDVLRAMLESDPSELSFDASCCCQTYLTEYLAEEACHIVSWKRVWCGLKIADDGEAWYEVEVCLGARIPSYVWS
jgi:hypothetical protein